MKVNRTGFQLHLRNYFPWFAVEIIDVKNPALLIHNDHNLQSTLWNCWISCELNTKGQGVRCKGPGKACLFLFALFLTLFLSSLHYLLRADVGEKKISGHANSHQLTMYSPVGCLQCVIRVMLLWSHVEVSASSASAKNWVEFVYCYACVYGVHLHVCSGLVVLCVVYTRMMLL